MAGTVNKKTCATCKYWQPVDDQNIPISDPPTPTTITKGQCRRRGPQPCPPMWPITNNNDWCGEYDKA